MTRRGAVTPVATLATGLAVALLAACTAPVAVPWDERKPALTGTLWRWTETLMSDARRTRPAAPERYTLDFLPGGTARVRADCNTGSGRYETGADHQLTLARMAVTQAACLPGSLGDTYLRDLAGVSGYRFAGDELVLMLGQEQGTMRFVPLKR